MDTSDPQRARQLNARLREDIDALLAQRSEKLSGEEQAVVEAFCRVDRHLGPEQFKDVAGGEGGQVVPAVVRRVMDLLCELGFAVRRDFGDGPRYEHLHVGEHHDHLICTHCGHVAEFTDPRIEELQAYHAAHLGFRPIRHKLEIYGLCRRCAARLSPTRALAECEVGERLTVVSISGPADDARHLADMGLAAGAEIEVLGAAGTLMIAVGGTRLGLDPKLAAEVRVAVADGGRPSPWGPATPPHGPHGGPHRRRRGGQ